jgi:violaxanthin de-epoxidase
MQASCSSLIGRSRITRDSPQGCRIRLVESRRLIGEVKRCSILQPSNGQNDVGEGDAWKILWHTMAATALSISLTLGGSVHADQAYAATKNKEVGTCVLRNCQKALAGCLGDAQCLENLICLQTCSGKDDETACQIKCGDKYQDAAIDTFNKCAVSEKKCVPQKVDEGLYPVPPDCALDRNFDLSSFQGRWYITAGLNPLFDTFPCQEHYFASTSTSKDVLYAEINWRIPISNGKDFLQRSTMQRFVQTPDNPAILLNHDNEYLHYQDDWYIIASKPDKYVFIYYRGQNDAWKGYGGATVYTRESHLPDEYIPELREAAKSAGLNWDDFTITDNSCPPKPQMTGPFEELEDDLEKVERFASKEVSILEQTIEPELISFGKGFTILEKKVENAAVEVVKEVEEEEEILLKELAREREEATKLIRQFQQQPSSKPFWRRFF